MSDIIHGKKRRLVELLYRKTLERNINWTINDEGQIYATIAERSVFIYYRLSGEGEDLVVFNIFGKDGKLTDSFNDETISYDKTVPLGFDNWYLLCAALLEMGKRQASGADDALDAMIDELDDIPF